VAFAEQADEWACAGADGHCGEIWCASGAFGDFCYSGGQAVAGEVVK